MNAAWRRARRAPWAALAACILLAHLLQAPALAGGNERPATVPAPASADAAQTAPAADASPAARDSKHKRTKAATDPAPTESVTTESAAAEPAPTDPAATEAPIPSDTPESTESAAPTAIPTDAPTAPAAPVDSAPPASELATPTAAATAAPADQTAATDIPTEPPAATDVPTEPPPASTPSPTSVPAATAPADGSSPAVIDTVWIVGSEGAACHAQMDIGSPVLAVFPEGAQVGVIGRTIGDWQPVLCNGSPGYLRASSITWWPPTVGDAATPAAAADDATPGAASDGNAAAGQQVANYALQYVGYPYVDAAEGPNAFDCSGFTMFVIQHTLGLNITHDMFVQYDMGQKIDRSDLQPGDLVFFQNTFRPGLSHVGIYIGKGQFVDAENPQTGVVVSDLNSDYYSSRWYGAVRYS